MARQNSRLGREPKGCAMVETSVRGGWAVLLVVGVLAGCGKVYTYYPVLTQHNDALRSGKQLELNLTPANVATGFFCSSANR